MVVEQLSFVPVDAMDKVHELRKSFFVRFKALQKEVDFLTEELYSIKSQLKEQTKNEKREESA